MVKMKKILYSILAIAFSIFAVSCEKDPVGMTATVDAAGDWYVVADGCDADGNVIEGMEDFFGVGYWHLLTYNTASNDTNELYLSDLGNLWEFTVKVKLNLDALTFDTDGKLVVNEVYECGVKIVGGKITPNGTTTPSGMPADAIELLVLFDDDSYAGAYYDVLKIHGFRYTGFVADE